MAKARKRPVVIEYVLFDGSNWEEVQEFVGVRVAPYNPEYTLPMFDRVENWWPAHETEPNIVAVVFDELHSTWVGVKSGDYIIKGMKGEFYPHDGELFWKAYEPVED